MWPREEPSPAAAEAERPSEPQSVDLGSEGPQMVVEAEVPVPVWDELEPSATEPESFEPQEALDIMDETADEFGDEESTETAATTEAGGQSADEESPTEERRPRRRRRRCGRGRGRDDVSPLPRGEDRGEDEKAERRRPGGPGEETAGDEVVCEGVESGADDSVEEAAEEDRPEDERTERGGRRRRRGQGRFRDQLRDEATVGEEGATDDDDFDFGSVEEERAEEEGAIDVEAPGQQENGMHDDAGEHDFDDDDEHDGEHDEEGGDSPRIGFRNIPTWQDAIGVMIAKNMESRARNPGGSRGPGGRGGRGGGRGRGRRP